MFLVQGGIQKETTFKKYKLTLFTVLQIAFFHLTMLGTFLQVNKQVKLFSVQCAMLLFLY